MLEIGITEKLLVSVESKVDKIAKRFPTLKWLQKCCKGTYAMKPTLITCPNIFFNVLSSTADISCRIGLHKAKSPASYQILLSNFSISMKKCKNGQLQSQNSSTFH